MNVLIVSFIGLVASSATNSTVAPSEISSSMPIIDYEPEPTIQGDLLRNILLCLPWIRMGANAIPVKNNLQRKLIKGAIEGLEQEQEILLYHDMRRGFMHAAGNMTEIAKSMQGGLLTAPMPQTTARLQLTHLVISNINAALADYDKVHESDPDATDEIEETMKIEAIRASRDKIQAYAESGTGDWSQINAEAIVLLTGATYQLHELLEGVPLNNFCCGMF